MRHHRANSLTRGELSLMLPCLVVAVVSLALTLQSSRGGRELGSTISSLAVLANTFLLFRHVARLDREESARHAADRAASRQPNTNVEP